MAAVNLSSLTYLAVGPNSTKWAAQVACPAINVYTVNLQNAVSRNDEPVHLKFATIDNIGNTAAVPVTLGNYTFTVPPATRETFELPAGLGQMSFSVNQGTVTLTVSEDRLASDQTNSLLVQQTAAATLTYQFIGPFTVTQNQAATDLNKTALFAPTAADMQYNLLLGSTAGNGWLEFVYNFGSKNVILTPNVPNTINGLASVTLAPGASGYIQSDGNNWYANIGVQSDQPLVASGVIAAGSAFLSINFTGLTQFRALKLVLTDITLSSATSLMAIQFSINAGVSYLVTNYYMTGLVVRGGTVAGDQQPNVAYGAFSYTGTGIGVGVAAGGSWDIILPDPFDTLTYPSYRAEGLYIEAAGNIVRVVGYGGFNEVAQAINAFRVGPQVGGATISTGKWALYGIK